MATKSEEGQFEASFECQECKALPPAPPVPVAPVTPPSSDDSSKYAHIPSLVSASSRIKLSVNSSSVTLLCLHWLSMCQHAFSKLAQVQELHVLPCDSDSMT